MPSKKELEARIAELEYRIEQLDQRLLAVETARIKQNHDIAMLSGNRHCVEGALEQLSEKLSLVDARSVGCMKDADYISDRCWAMSHALYSLVNGEPEAARNRLETSCTTWLKMRRPAHGTLTITESEE